MSALTIEGYGVTQTRVTEDDIELIRSWRLDPRVRRHMLYQGEISAEQQRAWFRSIDNDSNYFFVVHHEGQKIGLNSIKDIDWQRRSGQGGLFIVPEALRASLLVFRIAIPPLLWLFDEMGLEEVHAVIRADNRRAIRYNHALGHRFDPPIEGSDQVTSRLTKASFAPRRAFFERVFAGEVPCRVTR